MTAAVGKRAAASGFWGWLNGERRSPVLTDDGIGLSLANDYLPLHRFLANRPAESLVLTFIEIEELLGFRLPVSARRSVRWWTDTDPGSLAHANAWHLARRTATPDLTGQAVSFERSRFG